MMARRALTALCLLSCSLPALAVYRCEEGGKISYSDMVCAGGRQLDIAVPATDAADARLRLAQEKSELRRLESDRHKREAKEEKEQARIAHAMASRKKKCDTLARRVKWAEEDSRLARGRSADKTQRKAHRLVEQYDGECPK
ncbi:MAG: hypothetical protein ACM34A_16520 [Bacillota bacterium]